MFPEPSTFGSAYHYCHFALPLHNFVIASPHSFFIRFAVLDMDAMCLRRQVAACLNYLMSGMGYWSEDIGGFWRPTNQYTDASYHELLVRWFQFGVFTPLFRVHGSASNTEIWNYGEQPMERLNHTISLRYLLLPYTYSLSWNMSLEVAALH